MTLKQLLPHCRKPELSIPYNTCFVVKKKKSVWHTLSVKPVVNIPYCCDIKVTLVTLPYGNVVSTLKHLLCHNNMINFCMPSLISHNCSVPCCSYIKATLAILRHAKAVTTIKHMLCHNNMDFCTSSLIGQNCSEHALLQ